jgi:hypothetical protein
MITSAESDQHTTPGQTGEDHPQAATAHTSASWQQTFQNGLIVSAPLLTALIGTALPK